MVVWLSRLVRCAVALVLVSLVTAPLSLPAAQYVTYESITVADTAVGLATATISPTGQGQMTACSGRLTAAQINFRWDGTNPTAAEGTPLEVGDILPIDSHQDARRVRFIRTGAASGVLKVHCWR